MKYAAIGRGFSGETNSRDEAEEWIRNNKSGTLYVEVGCGSVPVSESEPVTPERSAEKHPLESPLSSAPGSVEEARQQLREAYEFAVGYVRGDSSYPLVHPHEAIERLITVAALQAPSPSGSASKGWVDGVLYCYGGCGLRYRDFPCDTLLPTPLWNRIATGLPFDDAQVGIEREGRGGVLCPSCIIQRLVALPECTAVFADIEDHRQSPSGSAWQPIETAPKDGTQVLAIDIGGCFIAEYRPSVRSWVDGQARCWEPTHWMPLPMPPSSPSPTAEKNT